MQAIEFETMIDKKCHICLPENLKFAYGRVARFVVLLPEQAETIPKKRMPGSAKGILKVLSEDDEPMGR